MSTPSANENRQHIRVNIERNLFIMLSDGEKVKAKMVNISKGGIGITYPIATDMGTKLKILFTIPTDNDAIPIRANVTVCHVHFSGNEFHIGLEFDDMEMTDKIVISSFIQKKLTQKKHSQKVIVANNKH
ncbi:MAG: PilZ domain-containing protein [Gammaproteobacteria bacterium]